MSASDLAAMLFKAGRSDCQVALVLEMSLDSARELRQNLGLPTMPRKVYVTATPEMITEINDRRCDGEKVEAIAEDLGLSVRTVYKHLRPQLKSGMPTYQSARTKATRRAWMLKIQPLGATAARLVGFGYAPLRKPEWERS